jgi:hypothetical protein
VDGRDERDVKIVFCRGGRESSNPAAGVFAECLDLMSGEIASDIFGRFIGSVALRCDDQLEFAT